MKILGIETSCDETAVCIIETRESEKETILTVLGNQLYSQTTIHEKYGGVYPMMAKREHTKNLVPLLEKCLVEANLLNKKTSAKIKKTLFSALKKILEREDPLYEELIKLLEKTERPPIDAIAVTNGPGLEPALWVGVSFAKALSIAWNIPVIPTNHMEGHIVVSSLFKKDTAKNKTSFIIQKTKYPAIALLISGGHTQLVYLKDKLDYKIIGGTRDDAVGEAYDKVARMLGLPYPGGPQISKYSDTWKKKGASLQTFKFPRPMIHSKDLDFSFSGLKTSVLYAIKEIPELTEEIKQEIAFEFQKAVIDVIVAKTKTAIIEYGAKTLIAGGGVIANKDIRLALEDLTKETGVDFRLPEISSSTDNALMIALAGYINIASGKKTTKDFKASGNLSL